MTVGAEALLQQKGDLAAMDNAHAQCYNCKSFGRFAKGWPLDGFYRIGPNGLPVRARDPSRDSPQVSQQAKDKATITQSLKLGGSCPESPKGVPVQRAESADSCDQSPTRKPSLTAVTAK